MQAAGGVQLGSSTVAVLNALVVYEETTGGSCLRLQLLAREDVGRRWAVACRPC